MINFGRASLSLYSCSRQRIFDKSPGIKNLYITVCISRRQLQAHHHGLLRTTECVVVPQRVFSRLSTSYSKWAKALDSKDTKDDAVPFLQSKAHKFKVDDAYSVDTVKDRSRQRFSLPLGLGIFGVIIYFGFLRDYGKEDKSVVAFLTKDISDKLPDDVRERIYSELNQSKSPDQTTSRSNND